MPKDKPNRVVFAVIALVVVITIVLILQQGGATGRMAEGATKIYDDGRIAKFDTDLNSVPDTIVVYKDLDNSGTLTAGDPVEVEANKLTDLKGTSLTK